MSLEMKFDERHLQSIISLNNHLIRDCADYENGDSRNPQGQERALDREQTGKGSAQKEPYPINSFLMNLGNEPPPLSFNDFMLINP